MSQKIVVLLVAFGAYMFVTVQVNRGKYRFRWFAASTVAMILVYILFIVYSSAL